MQAPLFEIVLLKANQTSQQKITSKSKIYEDYYLHQICKKPIQIFSIDCRHENMMDYSADLSQIILKLDD